MGVTLLIALLAGCASAPTYRPPVPLPGGRQIEVGGGPHAAANAFGAGGGASAWGTYRSDLGVDFFGSAHGAALARFDGGLTGPFAGGSVGLRGRYAFSPDMIFASEVGVDYLEDQLRRSAVRHVTGFIRIPVAQRVVGDLWVYAAPTLGLSLPVYEAPPLPFFGVSEMPFGFSWTLNESFTLVAEGGAWGGGFWQLENGGYGGIAIIFHPL